MWFLSGAVSSAPAYRSCTIPAETALFFPIVDVVNDNTVAAGQTPTTFTLSQLKQGAADFINNTTGWSAKIDGHVVAHGTGAQGPFRTAAGPLFYTLPADSFLTFVNGTAWEVGEVPPPGGVADGIYLFVAPLRAGTHVLHWSTTGSGLNQEITYHLTVKPDLH